MRNEDHKMIAAFVAGHVMATGTLDPAAVASKALDIADAIETEATRRYPSPADVPDHDPPE